MNSESIKFIRRTQVEERTGLARSTIYERVQKKTFPAPINLGGQTVGWIESEISEWMNRQIENSRQGEIS